MTHPISVDHALLVFRRDANLAALVREKIADADYSRNLARHSEEAIAALAALQAERDALRLECHTRKEDYARLGDLWRSDEAKYVARAERAESALDALRGQVAGLRQFASAMMDRWPMGDVDGGDLQNEAVNAGLLREVVMTDFCGESCSCAEYATRAELPVTCYRRTTLLTGKPESDERIAALLAIKERMG